MTLNFDCLGSTFQVQELKAWVTMFHLHGATDPTQGFRHARQTNTQTMSYTINPSLFILPYDLIALENFLVTGYRMLKLNDLLLQSVLNRISVRTT